MEAAKYNVYLPHKNVSDTSVRKIYDLKWQSTATVFFFCKSFKRQIFHRSTVTFILYIFDAKRGKTLQKNNKQNLLVYKLPKTYQRESRGGTLQGVIPHLRIKKKVIGKKWKFKISGKRTNTFSSKSEYAPAKTSGIRK